MTKNEYTERFIDHMVNEYELDKAIAAVDCEEWMTENLCHPEADADACFFYFYGG